MANANSNPSQCLPLRLPCGWQIPSKASRYMDWIGVTATMPSRRNVTSSGNDDKSES